jgi:L-ascorbate metabolism protein UlaG (beta-lactamase superfamily)
MTPLIFLLCLTAASCAILNQKKFGKSLEGERLERTKASPNYADGEFRNQTPTQMLAEGQSTMKIIVQSWFTHSERLRPESPLPTVKVDLTGPGAMDRNDDVLIWLGHSSYLIQLGGTRILVDPVFNDHGAPFSFLNKTFPGTDVYTPDNIPEIDVLLISHDHWDHLDFATVTALQPKVGKVVCPLGVGANLEYWGYTRDQIREADWWDKGLSLEDGPTITLVPARHYSGRLFHKNTTLWTGFVIEENGRRIFLSGDTGYGPHFAEIARAFGAFDLVALDGGQYDSRWPLIHMTPEEAVRAATEMGTKSMMLAHAGRFCISEHPWDEPFIRAAKAATDADFALLTPKIGEQVQLDRTGQSFPNWWEGID